MRLGDPVMVGEAGVGSCSLSARSLAIALALSLAACSSDATVDSSNSADKDTVGQDVVATDAARGGDSGDAGTPSQPSETRLCDPCDSNAQCHVAGGEFAACVVHGSMGSFCATACDNDLDCVYGFRCAEAKTVEGVELKQCVPMPAGGGAGLGTCDCSESAIARKAATTCTAQTAAGNTCVGKRVCGDLGLSGCDAPDAKPEICDGLDNDCDGKTDDVDCSDDNPCTDDACKPALGCASLPNALACDDGDDCTSADTCSARACKSGKAKDCDDKDPCTVDQCVHGQGCTSNPLAEGATCGAGKTCKQGKCLAAPPCGNGLLGAKETCDDGNITAGDGCSSTCQLELKLSPEQLGDYQMLTKDVTDIDTGGAGLSTYVIHGLKGFPFLLDGNGTPVMVATRHLKGRIVCQPHETFAAGKLTGKDDTGQLGNNIIKWLGKAQAKPKIGVQGKLKALKTFLDKQGHTVSVVAPDKLTGLDVYAMNPYSTYTDAQIKSLRAFVAAGGGLWFAGHAWWWGSQNGKTKVPDHYPGNKVLRDSGLTYTWDAGKGGKLKVTKEPPHPWKNARIALNAALMHVQKQTKLSLAQQKLAVVSPADALRVLTLTFTAYFDLGKTFKKHHGEVIPTAPKPVVKAKEPLAELVLRLDEKLALSVPAKDLWAHPAGDDFPGKVAADTPTVKKTLTIDGTHAGRHPKFAYSNPKAMGRRSLGLYAAPGAIITVQLDAKFADKGLHVLVGAHSDSIWKKDKWTRHPRITRSWPLDKAVTKAGNVFGGIVYIAVPYQAKIGPVQVTVTGAVEAPLYVHGKTTVAQWKATIRDRPAPWAELAGKSMILTMPSEYIRKLDNPDEVAALWDEVMDQSAILANIPKDRPRAERATYDRQISAGALHSGYPIMGHLNHGKGALEIAKIKASGNWGMFHEIGHNHQWRDTVIPKTTEVTVNLWSVHTCEKVTAKKDGSCSGNTEPAKAKKLVEDWVAKGAKYSDWGFWNALQMYLQIRKAFGWEVYTKVFQIYYDLPAAETPKNDQQRIDQWVVRLSKVCNKNLGPFFQSWALPVSQKALDSIKSLPAWFEDPMRVHLPYPAQVAATSASAVKATTANAGYDVVDPGGKGSNLTVFWGQKDAKTNDKSWQHSASLGPPKAGIASAPLTGLKKKTKYRYRLRIKSSLGAFWSPTAANFITGS